MCVRVCVCVCVCVCLCVRLCERMHLLARLSLYVHCLFVRFDLTYARLRENDS